MQSTEQLQRYFQKLDLPHYHPVRRLSQPALTDLLAQIKLKAWLKATQICPATAEEVAEVENVFSRLGRKEGDAAKRYSYNLRHWDCLRWFLFGGDIQLPIGVDSSKAVDPRTNPAITVPIPGFVITQDEHDDERPYKNLPTADYLRLLAYAWVHEPLLFVPKSRQLMVTWLFCAIASHELVARVARRTAWLSKKFDDANGHLQDRIKLICDLLPQDLPVPAVESTKGFLRCPETGSMIMAIGEESGKGLRQYTFSWIFSDEMGFQENAEDQYKAALATIKSKTGLSRYTGVSTPNGKNLFYSILSDSGHIATPSGAWSAFQE